MGAHLMRCMRQVALKTQETGGKCFAIVKGEGPGPNDYKVMGGAQARQCLRCVLGLLPLPLCPFMLVVTQNRC